MDGLGIGRRRLIEEIIKSNWDIKSVLKEKSNFSYNDLLFVIQELFTEEGKAYHGMTKGGKYGYTVFRAFVQHLLYRNLANYDSMVLLTSEKGTGKSSAAMMLAQEWCRLQGRPFMPEKYMAYNNADVMNKIDSLEPFSPLICDEAVRFASSADWAKAENKELKKKLAQVRTKHLFYILCFPLKIVKLEKNYLECLDGETLIKTEHGDIKIKDLEGKKNFKVYSLNITTNKIELKNAKECVKTKYDYVYEIITKSNMKILATKDHRFLTDNGWKHLHQLIINDKLINENLELDNIVSITKKDKRDVYDILDVKDNNNYIANKLVVHNSFTNYWCLTGDMRITTRDKTGMIRHTPLEKLNKYNPEVLSYNTTTKEYEFKKYDKKVKTKENAEIFEVELTNDLKIKCTEDHPFLTQRGWVRLKDLKEDDKIEVNTRKCKCCSIDFIPKKQQQLFCNKKCSDAFHVRSERQQKYNKKYNIENKEYCKVIKRKNYLEKRETILEKAEIYREKNRERINKYAKEYRKNNRDIILEQEKKHLKTHLNYKISKIMRGRLNTTLKRKNTKKTNSVLKYLGCSINKFKKHISDQFTEGMSWDNWGFYTWHIDHIKPCSHFDLRNEKERFECFNYKNQQPMWAKENLSKGDRYVG